MKKRLDLILVDRNYFETREKAKREIMVGNVIVNDKVETKPGTHFRDDEKLQIKVKDRLKYVSRGGLKLEKAINHWNINLNNKRVLDIGASTGGFTDCSLQNGAEYVYSVDVGTNQLDWKLRQDARVKSLEETHIKNLTLELLDNKKVDFIVIDVSFISLTKVIPYLNKFIIENGIILMLIKPQFEVGKEKIGRNGIVIEEKYHDEAIKKIVNCIIENNYELIEIIDSPITGTKGNKEFLILIKNKILHEEEK